MIALMVTLLLVLTGCVDVMQYISGQGSEAEVIFRLTLQKSAFELANSMSEEPQDLDRMFEQEFSLGEEEVFGELPPELNATYEAVRSEFEYGFELRYSVNRARSLELPPEGAPFVPRVSNRSIVIPLAPGDAAEGQGEDQFAAAFFGSSKYRLFLSKRFVSRVSSATIEIGQDVMPIDVKELPDVWLVEFPISLWLFAPEPPTIEVFF